MKLYPFPIYLALLFLFSWGCGSGNESTYYAVTINDWTHKYEPGQEKSLPVTLTARGSNGYSGNIQVHIKQDTSIVSTATTDAEVEANSEQQFTVTLTLPEAEGKYEIVAEIVGDRGQPVLNRRLIEVEKPLDLSM